MMGDFATNLAQGSALQRSDGLSGKETGMKLNRFFAMVSAVLALSAGVAQASGIFIPPRPPSAIKKPTDAKCEPADSDKCKKEAADKKAAK